jgi:hypothetical protein
LSHWETTSELEAEIEPAQVWRAAYADAGAWPKWNAEIKRADLDRPLGLGPAATRSLPGAQRAIVTLAGAAPQDPGD